MPYQSKCRNEVKEEVSFYPPCEHAISVLTVKSVPQASRFPEKVNQRLAGAPILPILKVLGGLVFV